MTDRSSIKKALAEHRLAPSKARGQNFLIHRAMAERIVAKAGVGPGDLVVELGVGFGSLTIPLAERAARVIGFEIDAGIVRWHREQGTLPANVELRHQDFLEADFAALADECGGPLKIVANLPYSVSNPLLFKLFEEHRAVAWAVLMLQKEVAQRLTAPAGTKQYGILSVLLAAYARVEKLLDVGPGQFHPRPKVDSQVVRIDFGEKTGAGEELPPFDRHLFTLVVKAAFQQRRKTLENALAASPSLGLSKSAVAELLAAAGLAPTVRAERLGVGEYVRLANLIAGRRSGAAG